MADCWHRLLGIKQSGSGTQLREYTIRHWRVIILLLRQKWQECKSLEGYFGEARNKLQPNQDLKKSTKLWHPRTMTRMMIYMWTSGCWWLCRVASATTYPGWKIFMKSMDHTWKFPIIAYLEETFGGPGQQELLQSGLFFLFSWEYWTLVIFFNFNTEYSWACMSYVYVLYVGEHLGNRCQRNRADTSVNLCM